MYHKTILENNMIEFLKTRFIFTTVVLKVFFWLCSCHGFLSVVLQALELTSAKDPQPILVHPSNHSNLHVFREE